LLSFSLPPHDKFGGFSCRLYLTARERGDDYFLGKQSALSSRLSIPSAVSRCCQFLSREHHQQHFSIDLRYFIFQCSHTAVVPVRIFAPSQKSSPRLFSINIDSTVGSLSLSSKSSYVAAAALSLYFSSSLSHCRKSFQKSPLIPDDETKNAMNEVCTQSARRVFPIFSVGKSETAVNAVNAPLLSQTHISALQTFALWREIFFLDKFGGTRRQTARGGAGCTATRWKINNPPLMVHD
jgi:hypothetical protein